jgi:hypothetical protein
MNVKRKLESRIRGWFPQEPRLPKTLPQINLQPSQAEPFLNRHRLTLGLVGGVLTILIAFGAFFVGLIFTDVFRGYGIYASGEREPMLMALRLFVLGGVGLGMGIIGVAGSRIGKRSGGILLIIAGVATLVLFSFFGILPAILMIVSGITEMGKNQLVASRIMVKETAKSSDAEPSLRKKVGVFLGEIVLFAIPISLGRSLPFTFPYNFLTIILPLITLVWVTFRLRRIHGLNDWYSILLFASALATVGLGGYLLRFQFIDFIGFTMLLLVDMSVFGLLYAWAQRTAHQKSIRLHKTLSMLLAITGIFMLGSSLAVVSHIEYKLTKADLSEEIIGNNLKLTEPVPDIEVPANLTNQDQVSISIVVSQKQGAVGRSNVDLTISDQPSVSNQTATIFFQESNITNDFFRKWDVPQNGTYYFLLRYNFVAEGYASTAITKHWSANASVPTQVSTPLLAEYMAPTLILGVTFLVGASSIPILRKFR